jgi:hypothetical protein
MYWSFRQQTRGPDPICPNVSHWSTMCSGK